jgi:methoxymalonate biosynthesis acyl carrier protein
VTTGQTAEALEDDLLGYLADRTKKSVEADQDIFADGLVSSMFAMELVVHLEQTYGVTIVGRDLRLDNFRTVRTMAQLVRRLRDA